MCLFNTNAQDIHFSQFRENPLLLNPALAGASDPLRASITRRDQWGSVTSPFKSYGVSFETRMKPGGWEQVDRFRSMTFKERDMGRLAAGVAIYSDKAGDGRLGTDIVSLSLATFVPLNKENFISLGMQPRLIQKKADANKLIFPDQYNGILYDPNKPSRDSQAGFNFHYLDLSAGILWSYKKKNSTTGRVERAANVGMACYQIAHTVQSPELTGNISQLKLVAHFDFLLPISNSDVTLAPAGMFQLQGTSQELVAGLIVRKQLNDDSKYTGLVKRHSLGAGLYYRNRDAIVISAELELHEQFKTHLSYDLNVSKLATASSMRGGFEISLSYRLPAPFLYQKK